MIKSLGFAAPGAAGLRPTIAATAGGHYAVAWLELGERERIQVALFDDEAQVMSDPAEVAPGWTALGTPQITDEEDHFRVVFSGRDAAGHEGLATLTVDGQGHPGAPRLWLAEPGARVLAAVTARGPGAPLVVGWYDRDAQRAVLRVSQVASQAPGTTAATAAGGDGKAALGLAPVEPWMDLVAGDDGVRAVWVAAEGSQSDPQDVVYRTTLDAQGVPRGAPLRLGAGEQPSLAPLEVGELVAATGGPGEPVRLFGISGARVVALPAPFEGNMGVIARSAHGSVLCVTQAGATFEGDVLRCTQIAGDGHAVPATEIGVAGGITGFHGMDLVGGPAGTAIAWQQDDPSAGTAVAVAILHCNIDHAAASGPSSKK